MSVDKRYIYTLNFKVKDRDNNNKASTSFYLNGYTLDFIYTLKQWVLEEGTVKWLPFEWSKIRISSADSKPGATLCVQQNKQYLRKALSNSFYLNDDALKIFIYRI